MMNMKLMFVLLIILMCGCFQCQKSSMDEREAREVLQKFYTDKSPEPIADHTLVEAGRAIVPYIVTEIKNKDMPKRRYAIGALGKMGDSRALPTLIDILDDISETPYIKGDALTAIWHINKALGEEYAKKYAGDKDYIDETIRLLRKGKI